MDGVDRSENHRSFSRPNNNKRKRTNGEEGGDIPGGLNRSVVVPSAVLQLKHLDVPLLSAATASPVDSLRLRPRRRYSIGRSPRRSDFLFSDARVSRRHCQIFFDPLRCKISIQEPRLPPSLNGLFVNGVRIIKEADLTAGDEVSLVCANWDCCSSSVRVGFIVENIVFKEKFASQLQFESQLQSQSQGSVSSRRGHKRVLASKLDEDCDFSFLDFKCENTITRANRLLSQCRDILHRDDCVSCTQASSFIEGTGTLPFPVVDANGTSLCGQSGNGTSLYGQSGDGVLPKTPEGQSPVFVSVDKDCLLFDEGIAKRKTNPRGGVPDPPGKTFYLNRLGFMDDASSHRTDVSLQELLHPVQNISRMFIATFTSDILWFLSSCEIPGNLPVTLACHSTDRCWNSSPEKRTSVPYLDFPNLVVVYPMFPEDIAFGKDLKRQGIGCHHPKLLVLQRDDFLRVIVTSANLVPSQWNVVTNTVWWQDFPRRSSPDYFPLFTHIHSWNINQEPKSDFCSQLAGFMASLLNDVPSQAQWIVELSKYDFGGAMAHLVASVPGIHSYRAPKTVPSIHFLQDASSSSGIKLLGSVETSVVGLSYLFHKAADSNGTLLKKLASFMDKSSEIADGFSKVLLQRNKIIPVDENAMNILVPNLKELAEDCVPLGFLPRKVAKWVSPLYDVGFFNFSAYVCRKQALAAALGGSNKKATLSIHVTQGPNFENITKMMQPEHVVAISSMIAAIQRCTGLWRLQEVLAQYKWPEELESEFIYSASSIGAINARFLAAFSAAAGKTSLQFDSDESDPEWGRWSTSQEVKNPSIRILFPTINRVQNACNGVLPSKRILCFSEKTWERLRKIDILNDAIPHPYNRVGHPMHVKVARRRFKSKTNVSSCGWVYCGSHNFSAAAWGRLISDSSYAPKVDDERFRGSSLDTRLHVCNYELGIIFTFPPTAVKSVDRKSSMNLDGIVLPFVVPPPKYGPRDRPATARAMREALAALNEKESQNPVEVEEVPDEDEPAEETNFVAEEKEEEKAYAKMLWSQIGSSHS